MPVETSAPEEARSSYRYSATDEALSILGAADLTVNGSEVAPTRVLRRLNHQVPTPYAQFILNNAAGVRITFVTAATRVELALRTHRTAYGGHISFATTVDLIDEGSVLTATIAGGIADTDHLSGDVRYEDGDIQRVVFDVRAENERVVELWLPHTAAVTIVEVVTDRPIRRADTSSRRRWIHYGSSISHSALSSKPTLTWPAIAARALGWQGTNLGLAGNAMLDPFMARTIAELPADIITIKVGINLINYDAMTLRTFNPSLHGFLDILRDGHPYVPIVLISPTAFAPAEHAPGPTSVNMQTMRGIAWDGDDVHGANALTQSRIRTAMKQIVRTRDDRAITYIDGRKLFSEDDDAAGLSADGLHPNEAGTILMGERFAALFAHHLGD